MRLQQGFVLISVLVITTIASVLALSAISENMLQERIAGNQQKQMNAHSLAEKGVFETQKFLAAQSSNVDLNTLLPDMNALYGGGYQISMSALNGNQLSFVSTGTFAGSKSRLWAKISVLSAPALSPGGIIGCDGVVMSGSGKVDSYNSNNGQYDSNNPNSNAVLQTISSNANVALTGDAPIYGNISVNGDFSSTGSASVVGDVTTAGSITMTGGTGGAGGGDYRIGGNVHVGGDLNLGSSTPVGGNADVVGNVIYPQSSAQLITGDLSVGGLVNGDNSANNGHSNLANAISYSAPGKPVLSSEICDPLDIKTEIASYTNLAANSNGNMDTSAWETASDTYEFTPAGAEMFDKNGKDHMVMKPSTEQTILGKANTPVHVFDDFSLKAGNINVSGGDVTIIVNGKFISSGGANSITVEAGSSLTILTANTIEIGSTGQLIAEGSVTDSGIAPIQIYSSYESKSDKDKGILLNGESDTYASVYAPLASVKVGAGGEILGELRGKAVDISGDGGIHFDEALGQTDPVSATYITKFAAMSYYYP